MPAKREVSIEGQVYESVTAASKMLGVKLPTLFSRLDSDVDTWANWCYVDGRPLGTRKAYVKPVVPVLYIFSNVHTGEYYVGSTTYLTGRRGFHYHRLRKGDHPCIKLQQAWNRDPVKEHWQWGLRFWQTREEMRQHEQELLDLARTDKLALNSVFNANSSICGVAERDPKKFAKKNLRTLEEIQAKRIEQLKRYRLQAALYGSRRGHQNPFSRAVYINGQYYGSIADASEATGLAFKHIRRRCLDKDFVHYSYDKPDADLERRLLANPISLAEDEEYEMANRGRLFRIGHDRKIRKNALTTTSQVVFVDDQEYPSINAAARALHRAPVSIRRLAEDPNCTTTYFREPT